MGKSAAAKEEGGKSQQQQPIKDLQEYEFF